MFKIKYSLVPNSFNEPGQKRFTARVRKKSTLRQDYLIRAMVERRTIYSDHVIRGVMQLMKETIEEQVLEESSVYTDRFRDKIFATDFREGELIELRGYGLKGKEKETFLGFFDGEEIYPLEIHRLYDRSILCQLPSDFPRVSINSISSARIRMSVKISNTAATP